MKKNRQIHPPTPRPAEEEIRDYAYHLFVQNGCVPGHDVEDWVEAEACLCAAIPKERSRIRLHHHIHGGEPTAYTVPSPESKNLAA